MAGSRTSSVVLPLAAVLAAGCLGSSDPVPDLASPGRNGRGEFFRWDPIEDPTEQILLPLAVGAEAFVGHSTGSCVESLLPALAQSSCGRITGHAEGTTLLATFDDRGRFVDWVTLPVRVPTGFTLHRRPHGADGLASGSHLVVPFGEWGDLVLELQDFGTPLMGRTVWDATVTPEGALNVEGYGRYVRVDCLRTGTAELAIKE